MNLNLPIANPKFMRGSTNIHEVWQLFFSYQYQLLYAISNNIKVCEEPLPWAKESIYCTVEFEDGNGSWAYLEPPVSGATIFFNFTQFSGKITKIIDLRHHLWGYRPLGNPGSATVEYSLT